mmetsp:Transcript_7730/g.11254  ORF Transcript_7730/g.11254 Transcript_7730/m.11254 type:complete len:415 (-) Transcript_7730:87-1331(-)
MKTVLNRRSPIFATCINLTIIVLIIMSNNNSVAVVKAFSSSRDSVPSNAKNTRWSPRSIPSDSLVIGYAHDAAKVEEAIKNGVNVVCWSFLNMVPTPSGKASIKTDLDLSAIRAIRERFNTVLHVAAFGGWNGPHPHPSPPGVGGKEWCDAFVDFNGQNGHLFDGIDWDLEGHDDRTAPTSLFAITTLDIMADFSLEAKTRYGMSVSLAPAESYLDAMAGPESDEEFSLLLNLPPLAYLNGSDDDRALLENTGFSHAGRQAYAYVLHRAGIDSFDWVSIQLYESYSRFLHETTRAEPQPITQVDALLNRVESFRSGYFVNLPDYKRVRIHVPLSKLVFGVANAWADGKKVVQVDPESLRQAEQILQKRYKSGLKGCMYWTIEEEGRDNVFMSSALASVFNDTDSMKTPTDSDEL